MQPETYCSGTFLEHVYASINQNLQDFLLDENKQWIVDLYRFLHGNCLLITDLKEEELVRRSMDSKASDYNPNFRKLWKNGRKTFVSFPETFDQMGVDEAYFHGKTSEIYFLSSSEVSSDEIEKKYGLAIASSESMERSIPGFFLYNIRPIKKGRGKGWSFLKEYRYPSNAAVIADNYILKEPKSKQDNLYKIIQAILPDEIEVDYHLTIFTRVVNNLAEQYKQIEEFLKQTYHYTIKLSIGILDLGSLSLHDRDIITNYCLYKSGAGFDLFKNSETGLKCKHNTTVFIFPVTYLGNAKEEIKIDDEQGTPGQASYYSTLSQLKKIWSELPESIGNQTTFMGERVNRLLD